jgi:transposase-like protein
MKAVAGDLKAIYQSINIEQAENALLAFGEKWDAKYPAISRSWTNHWQNIVTLFAFPQEIRKIIYTTNAIESLNSVIRKSINNRKIFPSDQSALKVIYLAIQKASQKWTMSLHDWRAAMNRFAIEFDGRIS